MTCGIYKLIFSSAKFYIGKSDNIERRYKQHLYYLKQHIGTAKMVEAYLLNSTPSVHTIEECKISELDEKEKYWIKYLNATNSLNSTEGGDGAGRGELNQKAVYSNATIEHCFNCIINNPTISLKEISEYTDISYSTVQNLAGGRLYLWLQEKRPEDFAKLVAIKGVRCKTSQLKSIHVRVLSPEGVEHIVTSIAEFADKWKLDRGNFGKLIRNQAKTCKGWKLAVGESS